MSYEQALQPALLPAFINLSAVAQATRWALNFNGVNMRAPFNERVINPDGDIDIEWQQIGLSLSGAAPKNIISQCISSNISEREFYLRWLGNGGALNCLLGGVDISPGGILPSDGKWRLTYNGNLCVVYKNGIEVARKISSRGAGREPNAVAVVGARTSGTGYLEFFNGILLDLKINGRLWPINTTNQSIQLPEPSGLGDELLTPLLLANPAAKGSQWTYLGDGRWQYIGDGTQNGLIFIGTASTPAEMFVEFEVESFSGAGNMRLTSVVTGVGDRLFNSVGKKRFFFTGDTVGNINIERNVAGAACSCIIKNISFKPLGTANPMTILNAVTENWLEVPA